VIALLAGLLELTFGYFSFVRTVTDGFGSESRPSDSYSTSSHSYRGDASRPARYSDAAPPSSSGGADYNKRYSDRDDSYDAHGGSSRDHGYNDRARDHDYHDRDDAVSDEPEKPKPKPKPRVKKTETPTTTKSHTPASTPQQDLISESFFDTPAAAPTVAPAAGGAVAFDAFGLGAAGGAASSAATFDAFGTSGFGAAPQPATSVGFTSDPFATPVRLIAPPGQKNAGVVSDVSHAVSFWFVMCRRSPRLSQHSSLTRSAFQAWTRSCSSSSRRCSTPCSNPCSRCADSPALVTVSPFWHKTAALAASPTWCSTLKQPRWAPWVLPPSRRC
jgi:hypothetical protein